MPSLRPTLFFVMLLSLLTALHTQAQSAPEILVRNESNVVIADGVTRDFKSLRLGQSISVTYLIMNQGEEPLTGLALTIDGAHPEDYVITQDLTSTSLTSGAVTGFTLRFAPTATGIRTAELHIASNDADENPFDIHLTGEGSIPEIQVVDPLGNEILQGGTYAYGTLPWSSQGTARQFLIKNTGVGALKVTNTTSTGEFTISPPFSNQSARPGADLILTVVFKPLAYGQRTGTIRIMSDDEDEGTFQFTVTASGIVSPFQAEQVANTLLTNNEIIQVGAAGVNVTSGKSTTITFKNVGPQQFTLGVALQGTNAADFSIKSAPASTLQPGESTTVTVLFVPKAPGAREAVLGIGHYATGSYTYFPLRLKGEGVYSRIEFASWLFSAFHGDPHGLVTIKRTEAHFPATIKLKTRALDAQAVPPLKVALPGVDYTPLTEETALVSFAAGEAEKTVSMQLLAPASGAKVNRYLGLELEAPSPGAISPSYHLAELRILGADTTRPTLTLITPAAGKISAAFPLMISGKAGDAMGIDRVEVWVDDEEPVRAFLGVATSNTAVPFSVELPVTEGIHDITVTAYDQRGNTTSVTRTINYTHRRRLFLNVIHGYEELRAGGGGTLALAATPSAHATQFLVNGFSRQIAVVPGTKLKLTTQVKSGAIFNSWEYQTTADFDSLQISRAGNELTLTMPDEDLYVSAHLAQGDFSPPEGVTKNLYWHLTPDGLPATPAPTVAGVAHLSGTLTATGAFSGKLLVNGLSMPVAATFYQGEMAAFTVAGKKRANLPFPGGELTIHGQQNEFLATITPTDTELEPMYGIPKRGVSSVPKGYYTVLMEFPGPQAFPTPASPGYATLNMTSAGMVNLAGVLADGTAITQSTALLSNSEVHTFIQLPTPGGKTKLGLFFGTLQMQGWGDDSLFYTTLSWYRPAAVSSSVLLYPAGWPGGIPLGANAVRYVPALTAQSVFFDGIPTNTPTPARLSFTGGKLASEIVKTNFGFKGNAVVKTAPADGSYTLALSPSTGIFSGTFTPNWSNPGSAKPAFKGVIIQGMIVSPGLGSGFFISNAKSDEPPESGEVTLGVPAQ